jgi:hypothetical protein
MYSQALDMKLLCSVMHSSGQQSERYSGWLPIVRGVVCV